MGPREPSRSSTAANCRGGRSRGRRAELVEEYTERYANPYIAAERGYVDDVIDPSETRRVLVKSLRLLASK